MGFAGLHTAYSGLSAAQRSMQVAGNNLANINTPGYTRQRAELSSVAAPSQVGQVKSTAPGQGVSVEAIARLGNLQNDAQVRGTAGIAAQSSAVAAGLDRIEMTFREPGDGGLSALLADHWSAWDDVGSNPGSAPEASTLIEASMGVANRLGQMHGELTQQYSDQHDQLTSRISDVNAYASAVAELNGQIRDAHNAGNNANALFDQRDQLTLRLSELTGAEVRQQPNGTAEVTIGGTHLVSETNARQLTVNGSPELASGQEVSISWTHRDGASARATISGGSVAGNISMLASAENGGHITSTVAKLNDVATNLATRVNQAHSEGVTVNGEPGGDFWSFDPANAAATLQVAVTRADQLATGNPGAGALDGHNASRISSFAGTPGGPDIAWSVMVSQMGTTMRNAAMNEVNTATAFQGAMERQQSQAGVSIDEENVSMLQSQYAYQGAARVMTAIDQMLDTLINRTGIVGR